MHADGTCWGGARTHTLARAPSAHAHVGPKATFVRGCSHKCEVLVFGRQRRTYHAGRFCPAMQLETASVPILRRILACRPLVVRLHLPVHPNPFGTRFARDNRHKACRDLHLRQPALYARHSQPHGCTRHLVPVSWQMLCKTRTNSR